MPDKKSMVVEFSPDGEVQAMNMEHVLPLVFLGRQEIYRASEIIFDEVSQSWGIHVAHYSKSVIEFKAPVKEASGFATYEEARGIEVRWFNECRLHQVEPESDDGQTILFLVKRDIEIPGPGSLIISHFDFM